MNFSKFFLSLLSITFATISMDKPAQPKPARPLPPIPTTKPAQPVNSALGKELESLLHRIVAGAYELKQKPILTEEAAKKIRDLVQRGADVNEEYLLAKAANIGNLEIFTLILNKVTNPLAARRALLTALIQNELGIAKLILQKFDINLLDTLDGYLIFEYLNELRFRKNLTGNKSQKEIAQVVKFLIVNNLSSLYIVDKQGNTPLMIVAQMGLADLVKLLLSYQVTPEEIQTEARSKSSYLSTLPADVLRMTKQYIKPFAGIAQRNNSGKTALDLARQSLYELGFKGNVQKKRALAETIAILEAAATKS